GRRGGGGGRAAGLAPRRNSVGGARGPWGRTTPAGSPPRPPPGPPLRSCPAAASWLQPLVVEEWLSGCPVTPTTTFLQVDSILGSAWRLPVKPSAKPTQVRTLDLPPRTDTAHKERRSEPGPPGTGHGDPNDTRP